MQGAEPLVDGIPVSKAFRHREKMLLQAVVEKYGKVFTFYITLGFKYKKAKVFLKTKVLVTIKIL